MKIVIREMLQRCLEMNRPHSVGSRPFAKLRSVSFGKYQRYMVVGRRFPRLFVVILMVTLCSISRSDRNLAKQSLVSGL